MHFLPLVFYWLRLQIIRRFPMRHGVVVPNCCIIRSSFYPGRNKSSKTPWPISSSIPRLPRTKKIAVRRSISSTETTWIRLWYESGSSTSDYIRRPFIGFAFFTTAGFLPALRQRSHNSLRTRAYLLKRLIFCNFEIMFLATIKPIKCISLAVDRSPRVHVMRSHRLSSGTFSAILS